MVWMCERAGMVDENRAARQEEKRKTSGKVYGCNVGGHVERWCDRRGS